HGRLIRELGALPSYYLRYFYAHDQVVAEQLEERPRAAVVAEIERSLLELYRDPALVEKPALLEQRGGAYYSEAAIGLVASLVNADGVVHEVDVRNDGALSGLADDDVVEVPARVAASGFEPLPQAQLEPELLGLVQHVAAYERLAVEAAVTRDAAIAHRALLTHPLIGQDALAEQLVDALLAPGAVAWRHPAQSQSAAATRRQTSRSSTRTARCSRSSAATPAHLSICRWTARSSCSTSSGVRHSTGPVSLPARLRPQRSSWPASTFPPSRPSSSRR